MNHEMDLADLSTAVRQLVEAHFSCVRRTVRMNLSRLTCAFRMPQPDASTADRVEAAPEAAKEIVMPSAIQLAAD